MASEAELIARSKGGDPEAFSALIKRYEDRIFNLAHKVCAGLPAEAEDVYQETFLTAFKKLAKFRADSELGTWLYRIASNLCWMRHRKKKAERMEPLLERHHGREAGPEEVSRKKALREAVAAALQALPVEYRMVLVLRDIQGRSGEEAAKALGISLAAVKSRLHRARRFLRDRLGA